MRGRVDGDQERRSSGIAASGCGLARLNSAPSRPVLDELHALHHQYMALIEVRSDIQVLCSYYLKYRSSQMIA
jgi:hypothetical protein